MIIALILFHISGHLLCPDTRLINTTSEAWDEEDDAIVTTATATCDRRYKRSPCLISLTKKEDQHYEAICGAKREAE